ncbi:hypothetical protein V491_04732 [Pseudogymnoascus sp. VKM F-3775]|nr:hypothetical protein V491_04732 [Pseudogymnoascus sp. VKM F-3775]
MPFISTFPLARGLFLGAPHQWAGGNNEVAGPAVAKLGALAGVQMYLVEDLVTCARDKIGQTIRSILGEPNNRPPDRPPDDRPPDDRPPDDRPPDDRPPDDRPPPHSAASQPTGPSIVRAADGFVTDPVHTIDVPVNRTATCPTVDRVSRHWMRTGATRQSAGVGEDMGFLASQVFG